LVPCVCNATRVANARGGIEPWSTLVEPRKIVVPASTSPTSTVVSAVIQAVRPMHRVINARGATSVSHRAWAVIESVADVPMMDRVIVIRLNAVIRRGWVMDRSLMSVRGRPHRRSVRRGMRRVVRDVWRDMRHAV
jgi:hypothetical protein